MLGHIVSKDGIRPDPDKISAVQHFPRPEKVKDLRSFLGLASYFRRFIRDFASIASPLHKLLGSGVPFVWSPECESAFVHLKCALTSEPVLCHFDETAPTLLHMDASGHGIGGILLQRDKCSRERVVSYASRVLTPAEKNYTITEQECLAVVWSVQKFRPYLHGRHFTVVTDHHALCWLSTLKNLSGRLGRWILRLQEYDFSITYKSGKKHQDADALSRCPLPSEPYNGTTTTARDELSAVPSPTVSCLATMGPTSSNECGSLLSHQRADPYCRRLTDRLDGTSPPPNARLRRQLPKFKPDTCALYRHIYHPDGQR